MRLDVQAALVRGELVHGDVEVVDGTIHASHEVTEVRYCRIADVNDWHERHREYAEAAHAAWCASESAA